MPTKTQKEYIDIPLRIEATPIHQFGKMETYVLPKTPMDIAFDFLCRIETALKAKDNQIELYRLQKNYF